MIVLLIPIGGKSIAVCCESGMWGRRSSGMRWLEERGRVRFETIQALTARDNEVMRKRVLGSAPLPSCLLAGKGLQSQERLADRGAQAGHRAPQLPCSMTWACRTIGTRPSMFAVRSWQVWIRRTFMEALPYCYRETGDRRFLDWALQMSVWTEGRFAERGKKKDDDWNWNLSQYVLRGLVTLYETSGDQRVRDLTVRMTQATLENMSPDTSDIQKGMGGGDRHFVFYQAWIATRVAKIMSDGDEITRRLITAVRRETAFQTPDGLFPSDHGVEAGLDTKWGSYYDPKSFVAYVPVLKAHMAARHLQ
jgi:hypothetical protein